MSDATSKTVEAQRKAELDKLPTWDLSEYYDSLEDPQIKADLQKADELSEAFSKKYKGRVAELSGDELATALEEDAEIERLVDKPQYYAMYQKTLDSNDPAVSKFGQSMSEAGNEIGQKTMFFGLELRDISADKFEEKMQGSEKLRKYEPLIKNILKGQPYKLADEIEEFIVRQSPAGPGQFVRFFEEDQSRRRYPLGDEMLTNVEIRAKFDDADIDVRKEAIESYTKVNAENVHVPVFVMNNIMKSKALMDAERGYATPMSSRNLSNDVDDEVVDTLIDTVKANYPATSQRFNKLLADMLGKEKIDYWDSNVDIPGHTETYIPWDEAKQMVLDGYREFSPKMAEIAEKFFDNGWIDAKPRPGKRGGAYSSGGHPDTHPQVMMNYTGKPRDVMTLAHELGHGVHQYLENEALGPILRGTPLNLAETASIFGEDIVFQKLLQRVENPTEKKLLLTEKVQDGLGTIITQIAFADFERKIHDARKEGELSADDFAGIWRESLDDRIAEENRGERLEDSKHGWGNIPHMFRTPFYVYAYAFANLVVNGLAKANEEGVENFEEKYLDALRAGGTKNYAELLEPFGIDAKSPDFWQKGIDVLIGHIDQLEAAIKEEKNQEKATGKDDEPVRITSAEIIGAAKGEQKQQARGRG